MPGPKSVLSTIPKKKKSLHNVIIRVHTFPSSYIFLLVFAFNFPPSFFSLVSLFKFDGSLQKSVRVSYFPFSFFSYCFYLGGLRLLPFCFVLEGRGGDSIPVIIIPWPPHFPSQSLSSWRFIHWEPYRAPLYQLLGPLPCLDSFICDYSCRVF